MKESILEVLMYLMENFTNVTGKQIFNQAELTDELREAGFQKRNITKAFNWLGSLVAEAQTEISSEIAIPRPAIRVFNSYECNLLDVNCRGLLMFLEQAGMLSLPTRELIIDRVMALGESEISLQQLKWIILMVLFNQPNQDVAVECIENLVIDKATADIH